jgi:hypothetical protein
MMHSAYDRLRSRRLPFPKLAYWMKESVIENASRMQV